MTSATTLTVTAFLLQRLADEEAPSWELVPYDCEPGCCAPVGYVGHHCLICGDISFGGTPSAIEEIAREHAERMHQRARVLAQCEALRQAISYCDMLDRGPALGAFSQAEAEHARHILHALCQPFADHPDFDPSWLAS